jgi:hypothetical protein
MASSHPKQPATADNHTPDDGNHLSSYNLFLPDESLTSSAKPPDIAWKIHACGIFAIIRILRFFLKKERPLKLPNFPNSLNDLEQLREKWLLYMRPDDYQIWPQTELSFIRRFLRVHSIHLLQGKVSAWCDFRATDTGADYESRSLRKLCDSEDIWKKRAIYAVIIECISCIKRKGVCDHAHILTIESNGKENGLKLFDQGGMGSAEKFCRSYDRHVVTDVFKAKRIEPRSRERV